MRDPFLYPLCVGLLIGVMLGAMIGAMGMLITVLREEKRSAARLSKWEGI